MSQEKLLSDFSGGMNALAAVDKLDLKECLLAENVRFDETGNILSAGAYSYQNSAPYQDAVGNKNVHSMYYNPSFGAVAGIGQDVFIGSTLGGLSRKLAAGNVSQQKISFASAPNRVYFDLGSVGYWTDLTNLLTVDWPPPVAGTYSSTGPNNGVLASSATATTNTATNFGFTLNTSTSLTGVGFQVIMTYTQSNVGLGTLAITSNTFQLLVGGSPVGTTTSFVNTYSGGGTGTGTSTNVVTTTATYSFGGGGANWGYPSLSAANVNAATFGLTYVTNAAVVGGTGTVQNISVQATAYQAVPPLIASVVAGPSVLNGTYSWKVTFVDSSGEESDASGDSNQIVIVNQYALLTSISTGDARTVARNIYRIGYAANTGLTLHYLVGTINDNTTTSFYDNVSDLAALTEGVILAGDVPGDYPNSRLGTSALVRFPVYHYDRVFWVNQAQKNQILWSKPLNGFAYPVVNTIDVGDSKPITRIISIFGELIIVKTDSIWRLTGTDETSFDLTQTPSAVGTDESFTVVALPDKVLFANRYGLWVFNGYTSQPLTTKLDLWFKQLDRTGVSLFGVNGFHPPEVKSLTVPLNFESVGNSEKMYFAYAEAGSLTNTTILAFDVKHGNVTKRELGTPNPLSLTIDPITGFVYVGDDQGRISLLDDWNGLGAGGGLLNFDFQHGYQDFQRGSNKRLPALEFYLNTNGQAVTPYVYFDNGIASETLASITTSSLQRVVRTLESTISRKCQNFSVRFNASLNPVNLNGTPQIQIVHVKPYFDIYTGRARTGQ